MHQNDGWFNPLTINGSSACAAPVPPTAAATGTRRSPTATTASAAADLLVRALHARPRLRELGRAHHHDRRRALLGARRRRRRLPRRRGQALPAGRDACACAASCTTSSSGPARSSTSSARPSTAIATLINSFIGPHALNAQFDFPIYFAIVSALGDLLAARCAISRARRPRRTRCSATRRCRRSSATTTWRASCRWPRAADNRSAGRGLERAAGDAVDRGRRTSSSGWRSPSSPRRRACRWSITATSTASLAPAIRTTVAS